MCSLRKSRSQSGYLPGMGEGGNGIARPRPYVGFCVQPHREARRGHRSGQDFYFLQSRAVKTAVSARAHGA